jgi:hypothetical protein
MTSPGDWAFRAEFLAQHADYLDRKADQVSDDLRTEAGRYRELARSARIRAEENERNCAP